MFWLTHWLTGSLTSWLLHRSSHLLVYKLPHSLTGTLNGPFTYWVTFLPTFWLVHLFKSLIGCPLTGLLINQLNSLFTASIRVWLSSSVITALICMSISWLIDCSLIGSINGSLTNGFTRPISGCFTWRPNHSYLLADSLVQPSTG